MTDSPERIWIDDERPIGGGCHVYNEWTGGVERYCVEYVRADLYEELKEENRND